MPLTPPSSLATVVDSHADADRFPAEGPIVLSPLPPEASCDYITNALLASKSLFQGLLLEENSN